MLRKMLQFLPLFLLFFFGCSSTTPLPENAVEISGTVTYDRVPVTVSYGIAKLNYDAVTKEPVKHAVVKAFGPDGNEVAQTTTDETGHYSLQVNQNQEVKIRVYARMYNEKMWDVKVVDNTNSDALYVMEGAYHSSKNKHNVRDLHAPSGWTGEGYTQPRVAAPFAILDSINDVMEKVRQADDEVVFPPLTVHWSVHNVAAGGDKESGQIITSHYDGERGLWILGDENSDTDEYDDHIIIHEWGHYFEDQFSRTDSIGGPHSPGEALDIRLAFGEGWGNALSGIATDDPIYFDTSGVRQSYGWYMNLEDGPQKNPGWYSEGSVQRILYDLYDSTNEEHDYVALGFKPIYETMIGKEKNTKAFTSIFSFINGLKEENWRQSNGIDKTVAYERINTITDSYGSNRTNVANTQNLLPLYRYLGLGETITVCNQNNYGVYNKLGNRSYIRINILEEGNYQINASPNGRIAPNQDPDILIYDPQKSQENIGISEMEGSPYDTLSIYLEKGEYLLDVYDVSFDNSCYNVSLNQGNSKYTKPTKDHAIMMKHEGKKRTLPKRHYY